MKKLVIISSFLFLIIQINCIKKEFTPNIVNVNDEQYLKMVNTTIEELRSWHPNDGSNYIIPSTANWVIQGVIVSSDVNSNFYKYIHIQDSTAGIQLMIDGSGLYASYPVGMRVFVKLAGLGLTTYNNQLELGLVDNTSQKVINIPVKLLDNYIVKGSLNNSVDTLKISDVSTLSSIYQSRLVKLSNVIIDSNYAGKKTMGDVVSQSSSYTIPIQDSRKNTVVLSTSPYAIFANQLAPQGAGYIIAVATQYGTDMQLAIRGMEDIHFNTDDTMIVNTAVPDNWKILKISEVRSWKRNISRLPMVGDTAIRGIVVSDNSFVNMPDSQLFIQDPDDNNRAICIFLNKKAGDIKFKHGDEIVVNLKGAVLTSQNAGKVIASFAANHGANVKDPTIVIVGSNKSVEPVSVSLDRLITDLATENPIHEAQLIKVENGYFGSRQGQTFSGNIYLSQKDNNQQLTSYTKPAYTGGNLVPNGLCSVTTLVAKYYGGYEFIFRMPTDVEDLHLDPPTGNLVAGNYTIAQIRNLYPGTGTYNILSDGEILVEGIIISDNSFNTLGVNGKTAIIQTPGGGQGILVVFNAAHTLNVGDKIQLNINGSKLVKGTGTPSYNVLAIDVSSVTNPIINTTPSTSVSTAEKITPQVVTLAQLNNNFDNYISQLVRVNNVAFSPLYQNKAYTASPVNKTIGNNSDSFNVYTYGTQTSGTTMAPTSYKTPSTAFDLIAIPVNNTSYLPSLYVQRAPIVAGITPVPTFTPTSGTSVTSPNTISVTLTNGDPTAMIYYTTDNSDPVTSSTRQIYLATPIIISTIGVTPIKAVAISTSGVASAVATATYTITNKLPMPTFNPPAGSYTTTQNVTITAVSGADIYYTTNGTTPTETPSLKYDGLPINISSTTTIKAIAVKAGMDNSDPATAIYTISTGGGTTIKWDFTAPPTAPINNTDGGVLTATLSIGNSNGGTIGSYTSNGLSSNTWTKTNATLTTPVQYWLFTLPTMTVNNFIKVDFKTGGSSTGPNDWIIEYSFDNTNWFPTSGNNYSIGSSASTTAVAESFTFNIGTPTTSQIYIRLKPTSINSIGGSTIQTAGTNRLNNIVITIN